MKMIKVLAVLIALYLIASCVFSVACALSADPWEFRQNRNGLLCVEVYSDSFVIYSPFCNWADVFLFGIVWEETEGMTSWSTFSDGFAYFGQY